MLLLKTICQLQSGSIKEKCGHSVGGEKAAQSHTKPRTFDFQGLKLPGSCAQFLLCAAHRAAALAIPADLSVNLRCSPC